MSSGSRGGPPMGRYGSSDEYGKRRKNFYASSTRRDFKSGSASGSSTSGPGLSSLSLSKPPPRAENPSNSEYPSRSRYRDSIPGGDPGNPLSAPGGQPVNPRSSSYSKDSRYGGYGPKQSYPYSSKHYQERPPNGAYGSFNNAKREQGDYIAYAGTSRDVDGSRDSWRSDRPKLNTSTSAKSFAPSRFNPNSIPVNARGGLNGLLSSGMDYKKERYDGYNNDESYNNRWKSSYPKPDKLRSSLSGSVGRPNPSKDRIRSSGLTNSMGTPHRNDSYYPSKPQPNRYVDRYSKEKSDYDYNGRHGDHEYAKQHEHQQSALSDDYNKSGVKANDGYENDGDHSIDNVDEDDEEVEDDDEEDDDEDNDDDNEDDNEDNEPDTSVEGAEGDAKHNILDAKASQVLNKADSDEIKAEKAALLKVHAPELFVVDNVIYYPEGCNQPIGKLDTQLLELQSEFDHAEEEDEDIPSMRFALAKPIKDLAEYPFFNSNLIHWSANVEKFSKIISERRTTLKRKQLGLWIHYEALRKENDKKRVFLEEQLKVIHPYDDEARRELQSIDIRVKNNDLSSDAQSQNYDSPVQSGRRNRRHGDLVTTEAEFQEILKSLENEEKEDPMIKAKKVSADIPDLILDPVQEEAYKFMDSNNIVHDKAEWATRIKADFMDSFSETEHELFCEAFCRAPKRFGEISRYMGGMRSSEECVVHYYMTKKAVNYKFLVSQFKKRTSKKTARRKSSKSKSTNIPTSDSTSELTPSLAQSIANEQTTEEPEPMSHPDEKAPVVDPIRSPETNKRKTSGEIVQEKKVDLIHDDVEQPPKKKSRKKKEEEEGPADVALDVETKSQEAHAQMNPVPIHPAPTEAVVQNGVAADDKKKSISSYWSITEVNEFPLLLTAYGSKWTSIADKLTSKTATMVRNYFQRNAEKYGWNELVAAADNRLAQTPNVDGKFSKVDSTIVVKPQKSHVESNGLPKTEMHVYDNEDEHGVPRKPEDQTMMGDAPKPLTVPVGTFQHILPLLHGVAAAPATEFEPKRSSVSSLLSDFSSPTKPYVAPLSTGPQVKVEVTKPSIMSLLNADSTPTKPAAVPLPLARPNNLANLLNAPSSPAPQAPPDPPAEEPERRNSIKSLLLADSSS